MEDRKILDHFIENYIEPYAAYLVLGFVLLFLLCLGRFIINRTGIFSYLFKNRLPTDNSTDLDMISVGVGLIAVLAGILALVVGMLLIAECSF